MACVPSRSLSRSDSPHAPAPASTAYTATRNWRRTRSTTVDREHGPDRTERVDALGQADHVPGQVVQGPEQVDVDRRLGLGPEADEQREDRADDEERDVGGPAPRPLVGVADPGHARSDHAATASSSASSEWYRLRSSSSPSCFGNRKNTSAAPRTIATSPGDVGPVGAVEERRLRGGDDLLRVLRILRGGVRRAGERLRELRLHAGAHAARSANPR